MTYHVFVDLLGTEGPAIHQSECRSVSNRKPRTQTTRWYGPFSARQAKLVAKREAGRKHAVRDAPRCCGGLGGKKDPEPDPWMQDAFVIPIMAPILA